MRERHLVRSFAMSWRPLLIAAIMAIHSALVLYQAKWDSPVWDEVAHFAAGVEHWRYGKFELFYVNPPFARMVATCLIPLLAPSADPYKYVSPAITPGGRVEFPVGSWLAKDMGPRYFDLLFIARACCLPFSLLAGFICYKWAADLWNFKAGIVALTLWCFSPTVLGYAHIITPDLPSACLAISSCYVFNQWLKSPSFLKASGVGGVLGIAELTKTTLLVLIPLFVLLWLVCRIHVIRNRRAAGRELLQLASIFIVCLWMLNLGYGFEGSFEKLGDFDFISSSLSGIPAPNGGAAHGNAFRQGILSVVPVPVPRNYLLGIDYMKWEFERKEWSFLDGEWRMGGWYYYYALGLLYKEPTPIWILGAMATLIWTIKDRKFHAIAVVILPFAALFGLVSSQTGFNHHLRYILPAFPFLVILISYVAKGMEAPPVKYGIVLGCLGWYVLSSLWVAPHSLSYFTELVGGPKSGHLHMDSSNVDWGQNLLYLRQWYDEHPTARPLHVKNALTLIAPDLAGMVALNIPRLESGEAGANGSSIEPGWYCISVDYVFNDRTHDFDYFQNLRPIDYVGGTMPIYYIDETLAKQLRLKVSSGNPSEMGKKNTRVGS